ncbi:hypothetical protein [Sulfobacillus thermosulfidooxidans]|nr:hypothetical protein [Sulfobacillus thermosulfidooxidans]
MHATGHRGTAFGCADPYGDSFITISAHANLEEGEDRCGLRL